MWQAAVQRATSSCHWAARGPLPSSAPLTLAAMMEGTGRGFCPTHGASIGFLTIVIVVGFSSQIPAKHDMWAGRGASYVEAKEHSRMDAWATM